MNLASLQSCSVFTKYLPLNIRKVTLTGFHLVLNKVCIAGLRPATPFYPKMEKQNESDLATYFHHNTYNSPKNTHTRTSTDHLVSASGFVESSQKAPCGTPKAGSE